MPTLDYFSLGHPLAKVRSFFALRARRRMFELFMKHIHPAANDRVLDLGVTPDTTLPESNLFEELYPFRDRLTVASIEDASNLLDRFPGLRFVQIQPGRLPFEDNFFDVIFCSAVLEHVGTRENQAKFVHECTRVARKVFITTPNRGFPVDFHTFLPLAHWLPTSWHHRILRIFGHSFFADINNLNLLSRSDLTKLSPPGVNSKVLFIRLFGIPSNLIFITEKN